MRIPYPRSTRTSPDRYAAAMTTAASSLAPWVLGSTIAALAVVLVGACGDADCPGIAAPACFQTVPQQQHGFPAPTFEQRLDSHGCATERCVCEDGLRYEERQNPIVFVGCVPDACPTGLPEPGPNGWRVGGDGCPVAAP